MSGTLGSKPVVLGVRGDEARGPLRHHPEPAAEGPYERDVPGRVHVRHARVPEVHGAAGHDGGRGGVGGTRDA